MRGFAAATVERDLSRIQQDVGPDQPLCAGYIACRRFADPGSIFCKRHYDSAHHTYGQKYFATQKFPGLPHMITDVERAEYCTKHMQQLSLPDVPQDLVQLSTRCRNPGPGTGNTFFIDTEFAGWFGGFELLLQIAFVDLKGNVTDVVIDYEKPLEDLVDHVLKVKSGQRPLYNHLPPSERTLRRVVDEHSMNHDLAGYDSCTTTMMQRGSLRRFYDKDGLLTTFRDRAMKPAEVLPFLQQRLRLQGLNIHEACSWNGR